MCLFDNEQHGCRDLKGAFTYPPGPVRFSNPAACRRILRPCEFHFYGVHSHISNGARTMPGRYLKFEVARRPSTSRTGPDRVQPTCIKALFDEEVYCSAPSWRPAGNWRRHFDARFYLIRSVRIRIVYICSTSETVLLMDLSTKIEKWAQKGILIRNGSSRILRVH